MSWQEAAREAREAIERAIPDKWRLQQGSAEGLKDVTQVPATCGLLSDAELRITELDASSLVKKLASGALSATQVTDAFCGRAAIAHQLVRRQLFTRPEIPLILIVYLQVNCLAAFFPGAALQRAAELDEHFKRTGKTVGPLHGLPIALKVL